MSIRAGKMLVVDDEPKICAVLSAFFSTRGYEVVNAYSGQEALATLERKRADVVLLDIMMPDMDGTEVFRRIRRSSPSVEVIIVTALADEDVSQQLLAAGAFDFVTKPFDLTYLDRVVSRLMTNQQKP